MKDLEKGTDWTEVYRPTKLDEVVGNPKAIQELKEWAISWESGEPEKKVAVLIGSPGTGKTSAALALANDFGWGVIEMNASDQRNAEAIKRIALRGALADTFTDEGEFLSSKDGCLKLIILDEADNIFGKEDYGGVPAIIDLIKSTKQPVILIVNDFYALSKKSEIIKSHSKQIRFNRIQPNTIKSVLKKIAKEQGIIVSERAIDLISANSNGDLRSAIRDFQAIALGKKEVTDKDTAVLSERLITKSLYDLITEVLHGSNPSRARSMFSEVNEEPEHVLLWIDENVPLEYRDPSDLYEAYLILARADVYLGRVLRRQYYGFWSYSIDLMSFGICSAKKKKYKEYVKYRFPLYLMKMSRSRSLRNVRDGIATKLGSLCHCSVYTARDEILPHFQYIYRKNKDFRIATSLELQLDAEEIAFLLDEKIDSNAVKHVLTDVQKVLGTESVPVERINDIEPMKSGEGNRAESIDSNLSTTQRSLFEY